MRTQENEVQQWITRRRRRWWIGGGVLVAAMIFGVGYVRVPEPSMEHGAPQGGVQPDEPATSGPSLRLAPAVLTRDEGCDFICAAMELLDHAREEGRSCGTQALGVGGEAMAWDDTLADLAGAQAEFLADVGYLAHDTPRNELGENVQQRSERWGIDRRTGEVLYRGSEDGEAAMRWWLRSPAHCAVLMHPRMVNIGLEWAHSDQGTIWVGILSD